MIIKSNRRVFVVKFSSEATWRQFLFICQTEKWAKSYLIFSHSGVWECADDSHVDER